MAFLELKGLSKSFDRPAVQGVDLALEEGEILALLGPSGCGKTTLMRLVAGLEEPDSGRVLFQGREITGLPPQKRNFGLMFQEFALFPHQNVRQNVAFGLKTQRLDPEEVQARTREMLELMAIEGLAGRNVADLSGGERQRVALARSLAPRPDLLMLDEPLGALDRILRERLLTEVRGVLKSLGMTSIFVTHDQSEALAVADRVAVMGQGRLIQAASPEELYLHPRTEFVARFLGFKNLIPGRVKPGGAVETALGDLFPTDVDASPGERVILVLRPEAAQAAQNGAPASFRARVVDRLFLGRHHRVTVEAPGGLELIFDLEGGNGLPDSGAELELILNPEGMAVVGPEE